MAIRTGILLTSMLIILLFSLITTVPIGIFSYVSVLLFLLLCYSVLQLSSNYFLLNFYTIFVLFSSSLVSILTNYYVYMIEINEISFPNHLAEKVSFQSALYILGGLCLFSFLNKTNIVVTKLNSASTFGVSFFLRCFIISLICVLLFFAIWFGIPSSYGIHRNDYWAYYAPSWGIHLNTWLIQSSFIMGCLYGIYGNKYKDLYLYLILIFVLLVFSNRVTGLLQSVIFFFTPFILLRKIQINLNLKWFLYAFCVLLLIFGILLLNLIFLNSSETLGQALASRIVLQSQMWWALENITQTTPRDLDEILKHYYGIGVGAADSGAYYLMYQVAPAFIVDDRFATRSTFALSGLYNNLYFFGYYLGTVVNVFYGAFFGLILFLLYKSIVSVNIVAAVFAFKLFIKIQSLLLTGVVPDLFDISTLVFLFGTLIFFRIRAKEED